MPKLAKSQNLLIIYELEKSGDLAGLTYQQLADLLELGHRATAMRLVKSLSVAKAQLPEIRARVAAIRAAQEAPG